MKIFKVNTDAGFHLQFPLYFREKPDREKIRKELKRLSGEKGKSILLYSRYEGFIREYTLEKVISRVLNKDGEFEIEEIELL